MFVYTKNLPDLKIGSLLKVVDTNDPEEVYGIALVTKNENENDFRMVTYLVLYNAYASDKKNNFVTSSERAWQDYIDAGFTFEIL